MSISISIVGRNPIIHHDFMECYWYVCVFCTAPLEMSQDSGKYDIFNLPAFDMACSPTNKNSDRWPTDGLRVLEKQQAFWDWTSVESNVGSDEWRQLGLDWIVGPHGKGFGELPSKMDIYALVSEVCVLCPILLPNTGCTSGLVFKCGCLRQHW